MFSNDYDKLFSKVRVIVYEGRVLLVGTVVEESIKEKLIKYLGIQKCQRSCKLYNNRKK